MEKDVIADPSIYTIEAGKLYMFVSQEAKSEWIKDSSKNLIAATKHWQYKSEKRFEQIAAKKRWKKDNSVELFTF
jgi:alpha-N-acetylglucosamine transferase